MMSLSFLSVSSFLVLLWMVLVIVSMRFQELLGPVDADSVWNGYGWSAASLEHVSALDPIVCSPLRVAVNSGLSIMMQELHMRLLILLVLGVYIPILRFFGNCCDEGCVCW